MLDLKWILENQELAMENLGAQGVDSDQFSPLQSLNQERKDLIQKTEKLKAERNAASGEVAKIKKSGGDASEIIAQTKTIGDEIKSLDQDLAGIEEKLKEVISSLPNITDPSVPKGSGEKENELVRKEGEPKKFSFTVKDHIELGEKLGILDFERASKIAGARFSVLKGDGVRLERALATYMLDTHTKEHGYTEYYTPYLANSQALFGTGQLPKFEEDLFKLEGTDYYLIPTAEVTLTNLYSGEILSEKDLPLKMTAFTPCFRSEAGSYGKDTRGLIRQHQFDKVELVKYVKPEGSMDELEKLTSHAEKILQSLGLPYQVMNLCTGDIGFSAAKTYDLEVWLPGQDGGKYREISSCSCFTDFQARRGNIRFRAEGEKKPKFVHTLNGSGLAVGRTWIAVVENYQNEDGSITIPEVLRPYMGGQERIEKQ